MPIFKIFTTSMIFLFTSMQAVANFDDNAAINQFYPQFSLAFDKLDASLVKSIYAENACYVPEHQSKAITMGRENIIALFAQFFGKIRLKEARIEIDFRIVERLLDTNIATDVGYYLVRFHPLDDEEPSSEFASKFVAVSQKKDDGKWYVTIDTNNRADTSFYYDAKPQLNLYYGRQFSRQTPVMNEP